MKFLLWGTVVIVSQSWRQSTLGDLVIKMPHDDRCLKGKEKSVSNVLERAQTAASTAFHKKGVHNIPVTKVSEYTTLAHWNGSFLEGLCCLYMSELAFSELGLLCEPVKSYVMWHLLLNQLEMCIFCHVSKQIWTIFLTNTWLEKCIKGAEIGWAALKHIWTYKWLYLLVSSNAFRTWIAAFYICTMSYTGFGRYFIAV